MTNFFKTFISSCSELINSSEQAFKQQFKIIPIKKEKLGILNSLILSSGIISVLLIALNILPTNPIFLSIELAIVSILFVISIWVTKNQFIHTLIAFLTAISMFSWLNSVSQRWNSIVYSLALLIILLFIIYFDLLKKNIVLQLTGLIILFLHFNRDIFSTIYPRSVTGHTGLTLGLNEFQDLWSRFNSISFSQLLFLPILYIAIQLARRTNRILFSNILTPIFHVLTLLTFVSIILSSQNILAIIALILLVIIASILALKNYFNLSFVYFLTFFALSFGLLITNYSLGDNIPFTLAITIFPIITGLSVLAKYLIDKSYIDHK